MMRAILAAVFIAIPSIASANLCSTFDAVKKSLTETHGEEPIGVGIQRGEMFVQVWVSEDTGTWTITRTNRAGLTCLIAAGKEWTDVKMPKGDPL